MDSASAALAAAASRLRVTSAAIVSTNPTMTCIRNSQPTVGIFLYPVRYRSRWIPADTASSSAPEIRSLSCSVLP